MFKIDVRPEGLRSSVVYSLMDLIQQRTTFEDSKKLQFFKNSEEKNIVESEYRKKINSRFEVKIGDHRIARVIGISEIADLKASVLSPSDNNNEEQEHHVIYTSDSRGEMNIMVLDPLLKLLEIQKFNLQVFNDKLYLKNLSFLKRKDNLVADKQADNLIDIIERSHTKYRPSFISGLVFSQNIIKAHDSSITSLDTIKKVNGVISCGSDKFTKIWSPYGELWC